ncbi:hypothetical protein EYF80_040178 [Liparis tanakae]|uniref:Uncharacterized protein n=1 Tax=Liparis tanakae TaxID=230148 RepID=A0A4Z2G8X5_9TELE|nr:hypothetical protein EYF80_040178 [Liparis tanakae]
MKNRDRSPACAEPGSTATAICARNTCRIAAGEFLLPAQESVEWWSAAMPENSEGSSVPFFTFTSSFSRAAAPCWPPFTLFHFILRFWNHTFTCDDRVLWRGSICRSPSTRLPPDPTAPGRIYVSRIDDQAVA